jgi:hypothetical protein
MDPERRDTFWFSLESVFYPLDCSTGLGPTNFSALLGHRRRLLRLRFLASGKRLAAES